MNRCRTSTCWRAPGCDGFHRRVALHGKQHADEVFNLFDRGSLVGIVSGKPIGTLIS